MCQHKLTNGNQCRIQREPYCHIHMKLYNNTDSNQNIEKNINKEEHNKIKLDESLSNNKDDIKDDIKKLIAKLRNDKITIQKELFLSKDIIKKIENELNEYREKYDKMSIIFNKLKEDRKVNECPICTEDTCDIYKTVCCNQLICNDCIINTGSGLCPYCRTDIISHLDENMKKKVEIAKIRNKKNIGFGKRDPISTKNFKITK